jgi:hypothetical protein
VIVLAWNDGPSGWEILSTLATCAAVLVALGLAVIPTIYRNVWKAPRLLLECAGGEPYERGAHDTQTEWVYLRARVRNVGRGSANNVRAVLVRASRLDDDRWVELRTDPFELHWVSSAPPPGVAMVNGQPVTTSGPSSSRLDLTPKDYDYIDVCRHSRRDLELVAHNPRPRGFSFFSEGPFALHEAVIRLSGDELDPVEWGLRFRFDPSDTGRFVDVEVRKAAASGSPRA